MTEICLAVPSLTGEVQVMTEWLAVFTGHDKPPKVTVGLPMPNEVPVMVTTAVEPTGPVRPTEGVIEVMLGAA